MRTGKILIGILGGWVACAGIPRAHAAEAEDNAYQNIADRNVFGLKPTPPPPDVTPPKQPTPKIFLTGISTLGGEKRALLKTTPPAKPGEAAKEHSYILKEGERQDDVEVVAIDEKEGAVKLTYAGEEVSVNFKDNAVATAAPSAPPPGAPAPAGQPGVVPRPTMGNPAGHPAFAPPTAPSMPGGNPAANPGATQAGAGVATPATQPMPVNFTQEQGELLVELNREANSNGEFPPLPPTGLSEALDQAAQAEAAAGNGGVKAPAGVRLPGRAGTVPFPGSF